MKKGSILDKVDNKYRLSMMGNLNGCVGDGVWENKTSPFVIPSKNWNGRRVADFYSKGGLWLSNIYFKCKYTTAARGSHGIEVKCKIDLVLVEKTMLTYYYDWNMMNGQG